MDAISAYSFASCVWNVLQAVPLIVGPQAIIALLAVSEYPRRISDMEAYFAQSLGFALLALGFITVVLTGSVPVGPASSTIHDTPSPYSWPVILLTTLYHGASAFRDWTRYAGAARVGYLLGFLGSTILAVFGTWCLLFGGEKARLSRRTGADKRTSGFPFRNAEADRRKAR